MSHFFRYTNLFPRFNSIQAIKIQFLPNPFRKCYYQANPPSSLFQYFQSSLGFPPERALKVFQKLNHRNPQNPDAVLTFFRSNGLSETHIKSILDRAPSFLCCVPESRLRPKFQFFQEKGISETDLTALVVSNPYLFTYSLEGHIKPVFNILRSILGTDEFAVQLLIRSKLKFNRHHLSTNLAILRNCGVQNHHISKLVMSHPKALDAKIDRFNEAVEMVKGMGFKPQSYSFVLAVLTTAGLSRKKWDAKFKIYTSLGWSGEEIRLLFCKQPTCMRISGEKIRMGLIYLTKELGWGPSYILIYPTLLFHSLEKRIIPRHRFLQFLASKGFTRKDENFASSFRITEKMFLKNFVLRYVSEVPDILKIYESLMG